MKELGNYPNWIGSREAVENGTRTVYEASQEESSGYSVITFTKKATDGTVLEQYKYKVTGDSVEQMK
jgi:bla regulator protein BlaR1